MRLLVLTQAVDTEDPILGFMHRWIEELATHYESVEVICLKSGRFNLPANVTVHSLGKPAFAKAPAGKRNRLVSRIKYVSRFYRYIFSLRRKYDTVFVHMNQEYVLLGGLPWKLWRKPVVLWRNHKVGFISTHIAAALVRTVCYTSPSAYIAHFKNAVRMPIGIDTKVFVRPSETSPPHSIIFLGRIDGVKKPIEFINALKQLLADGFDFKADIYGDPTYPNDPYFPKFKDAIAPLEASGHLTLHHSIPNTETPAVYGKHAIYVNLTPSGSFDKTIGEAMACGCIVVVANDALRGVIPDALIVDPDDKASVVAGIRAALMLTKVERLSISDTSRDYIEHQHSLKLLSQKLVDVLRK